MGLCLEVPFTYLGECRIVAGDRGDSSDKLYGEYQTDARVVIIMVPRAAKHLFRVEQFLEMRAQAYRLFAAGFFGG